MLDKPVVNTLIVIGFTGGKKAYLNVDEDEAVARYMHTDGEFMTEAEVRERVSKFTFEDTFECYDAWWYEK